MIYIHYRIAMYSFYFINFVSFSFDNVCKTIVWIIVTHRTERYLSETMVILRRRRWSRYIFYLFTHWHKVLIVFIEFFQQVNSLCIYRWSVYFWSRLSFSNNLVLLLWALSIIEMIINNFYKLILNSWCIRFAIVWFFRFSEDSLIFMNIFFHKEFCDTIFMRVCDLFFQLDESIKSFSDLYFVMLAIIKDSIFCFLKNWLINIIFTKVFLKSTGKLIVLKFFFN